ncbi:hypothetical protein CSUI_004748, partial [Cystoisospora suis]
MKENLNSSSSLSSSSSSSLAPSSSLSPSSSSSCLPSFSSSSSSSLPSSSSFLPGDDLRGLSSSSAPLSIDMRREMFEAEERIWERLRRQVEEEEEKKKRERHREKLLQQSRLYFESRYLLPRDYCYGCHYTLHPPRGLIPEWTSSWSFSSCAFPGKDLSHLPHDATTTSENADASHRKHRRSMCSSSSSSSSSGRWKGKVHASSAGWASCDGRGGGGKMGGEKGEEREEERKDGREMLFLRQPKAYSPQKGRVLLSIRKKEGDITQRKDTSHPFFNRSSLLIGENHDKIKRTDPGVCTAPLLSRTLEGCDLIHSFPSSDQKPSSSSSSLSLSLRKEKCREADLHCSSNSLCLGYLPRLTFLSADAWKYHRRKILPSSSSSLSSPNNVSCPLSSSSFLSRPSLSPPAPIPSCQSYTPDVSGVYTPETSWKNDEEEMISIMQQCTYNFTQNFQMFHSFLRTYLQTTPPGRHEASEPSRVSMSPSLRDRKRKFQRQKKMKKGDEAREEKGLVFSSPRRRRKSLQRRKRTASDFFSDEEEEERDIEGDMEESDEEEEEEEDEEGYVDSRRSHNNRYRHVEEEDREEEEKKKKEISSSDDREKEYLLQYSLRYRDALVATHNMILIIMYDLSVKHTLKRRGILPPPSEPLANPQTSSL